MQILFFSPYAGIWQHAFPESTVASTLEKAGHTIHYVTCSGLYQKSCLTMQACGQNHFAQKAERIKTCQRCKKNKNLLTERFPFVETPIENYLPLDKINAIDKLVDSIDEADYINYHYQGIDVGKSTLGLILLLNKKSNRELTSEEKSIFALELKHCLYTIEAANSLFQTIKPDRVFIYNTQYPSNNVLAKYAQARQISVYYMHSGLNLGNRLNRLIIGRDNYRTVYSEMLKAWQSYGKYSPTNRQVCQDITKHFHTLLDGVNPFVYSSGINQSSNIRDYFAIPEHRAVVLMSLSSYDELFAAQALGVLPENLPAAFESQIEWVLETMRYIEQREDLHLVIRVHPREFPNKKESITSDHARALKAALTKTPANVSINWPSDNISIYNFVGPTKLCLNYISSVGKELTLFGIPVLSYAPEAYIFYPVDILTLSTSKTDYFDQISKVLDRPFDFKKIRLLYRWYAIEFCHSSLDLSQDINLTDQLPTKLLHRVNLKLHRTISPQYLQKKHLSQFKQSLTEHAHLVRMVEENEKSLIPFKMVPTEPETYLLQDETDCIYESLRQIYERIMGKASASKLIAQLKSTTAANVEDS